MWVIYDADRANTPSGNISTQEAAWHLFQTAVSLDTDVDSSV
jgi:hypothetical protein